MNNIPQVKVGIVAVSRDCFPESLSVNRRKALIDAYTKKFGATEIYECPVCIVESEIHMVQALEDVKNAATRLSFTLATSVRKFPRRCLQSTLTAPLCSVRPRKNPQKTSWTAAATHIAAC